MKIFMIQKNLQMKKREKKCNLRLNFTLLWSVLYGMEFIQDILFHFCIGFNSSRWLMSSIGKKRAKAQLLIDLMRNILLFTILLKIVCQLFT